MGALGLLSRLDSGPVVSILHSTTMTTWAMADGTMGDGPSSVLLPSAVPGPGFPLRSRPDTLCFYSLIKLVYSVVYMALAIWHSTTVCAVHAGRRGWQGKGVPAGRSDSTRTQNYRYAHPSAHNSWKNIMSDGHSRRARTTVASARIPRQLALWWPGVTADDAGAAPILSRRRTRSDHISRPSGNVSVDRRSRPRQAGRWLGPRGFMHMHMAGGRARGCATTATATAQIDRCRVVSRRARSCRSLRVALTASASAGRGSHGRVAPGPGPDRPRLPAEPTSAMRGGQQPSTGTAACSISILAGPGTAGVLPHNCRHRETESWWIGHRITHPSSSWNARTSKSAGEGKTALPVLY
jgi:hypothetical protein